MVAAGQREAERGHLARGSWRRCASSRAAEVVAGLDAGRARQRGGGDHRRQACWRTGRGASAGGACRRPRARPLVKPPEAPPSALPSVPVRMSTRPDDAAVLGRAAPRCADEADGVAVVDHDHGVVSLGEVADRGSLAMMPSIEKTPSVAIRRMPGAGGFAQAALEVGHVVVVVAVALRLAEPDAVDDRGVVERVGDDRVLLAEQRLEEAAVGVEAGRVEDGVLGAEEGREPGLERLVHLLGAADEADRGHAVAVAVERGLAGGDQRRGGRRGRGSCWRRSSAPGRRARRGSGRPAARRGRARPCRGLRRGWSRARPRGAGSGCRTSDSPLCRL